MTVGIKLAPTVYEIGTDSFLHAFFSTISHHLEPRGWGSVYPILMNKLYQGSLDHQDAGAALQELHQIKLELKRYKPDAVVWDIDDLRAKPPWVESVSAHITDLSNYFVTSGGRDLFELLFEVIGYLKEEGGVAKIVQYEGFPVGEMIHWDKKID